MDRLQRSMIDRKGSRFSTDEPTMARPTWRRSSSTTFFVQRTEVDVAYNRCHATADTRAASNSGALASRSLLHDQGIEVSGTPTIRPIDRQWTVLKDLEEYRSTIQKTTEFSTMRLEEDEAEDTTSKDSTETFDKAEDTTTWKLYGDFRQGRRH